MKSQDREAAYRRQRNGGELTPAQSRRLRRKAGHEMRGIMHEIGKITTEGLIRVQRRP